MTATTPDDCLLCGEFVDATEMASATFADASGRRRAHADCALRSVLGGWGHFVDHAFWCKTVGDPDGGLTYRESARRVAEHYRKATDL
jgi:hypothetical protein